MDGLLGVAGMIITSFLWIIPENSLLSTSKENTPFKSQISTRKLGS
jgi:hypothetical protein